MHLGAVGSGNVTKLVNNVMMYINFAGACEGMTMGVKAGIDPRAPLEVINSSMSQSRIMKSIVEVFLNGESWGFDTALAPRT